MLECTASIESVKIDMYMKDFTKIQKGLLEIDGIITTNVIITIIDMIILV